MLVQKMPSLAAYPHQRNLGSVLLTTPDFWAPAIVSLIVGLGLVGIAAANPFKNKAAQQGFLFMGAVIGAGGLAAVINLATSPKSA